MMLVIDTSGPDCAVALCDPATGKIIAETTENLGRGHAERLMPQLEALLGEASFSWQNITAIACTTGPGSFTGLRVGIATARGLALALDAPCIGITVFDAFSQACTAPTSVVMDARRDQLWVQHFSKTNCPISEPRAVSLSDIDAEDWQPALMGSGAHSVVAHRQTLRVVEGLDLPSPPIALVASAAALRHASHPEETQPKPFYLRAPDAKPQHGKQEAPA